MTKKNLRPKFIFAATSLFLLSSLFLTGCGANEYVHITHEKAAKMMCEEENAVIVDVRTAEEYNKRHIKGAVLLPLDEIEKGNAGRVLPDKNQTLLLYCWTGRRSEDAAKILVKNGYKKVYEFGGLVDWPGETESE